MGSSVRRSCGVKKNTLKKDDARLFLLVVVKEGMIRGDPKQAKLEEILAEDDSIDDASVEEEATRRANVNPAGRQRAMTREALMSLLSDDEEEAKAPVVAREEPQPNTQSPQVAPSPTSARAKLEELLGAESEDDEYEVRVLLKKNHHILFRSSTAPRLDGTVKVCCSSGHRTMTK